MSDRCFGALRDAVVRAVSSRARTAADVIVATLGEYGVRAAVPRLVVRRKGDAILVGPLEVPGVAGCGECADRRLPGDAVHGPPGVRLDPPAIETAAAVVADEAESPAPGMLTRVDIASLRVTRHRVLPVAECGRCPVAAGPLPQVSQTLAATYADPLTGALRDVPGYFGGSSATENEEIAILRALRASVAAGRPGVGIGRSMAEALTDAILDLAMADGLVRAWHNRRALPRASLRGLGDMESRMRVAAIRLRSGYEVDLFDATGPYSIPVVWALAVNREDDDPGPKSISAGGAGSRRSEAVRNAVAALDELIPRTVESFQDDIARAWRLARNPELVRSRQDAGLLYGVPSVFDRLSFLYDGEALTETPDQPTTVVDRLTEAGAEILTTDLTTVELAAGGLRAVRAEVPRLMPMIHGYAEAVRRFWPLPAYPYPFA
ncbi:TOMM precursor leader peptide-binding protein [[Actinomadura] parvosata]|uniref:TOMM precursor leader peptide-binding protein n=1 Tax=[Actinomadura] parvosata TaxID=1955412 RepID=UPI00406C84AF